MLQIDIDEILEIAQDIEDAGARFYRQAADLVDGSTKKVFLALAKMEDNHKVSFSSMKPKRSKAEKCLAEFDPDDGAGLYLDYAVKSKFFCNNPEDIFDGNESAIELITFAIDREKDSVLFFESLKDALQLDTDREIINNIIKEEISHTLTLTQIRAKIMEKKRKGK